MFRRLMAMILVCSVFSTHGTASAAEITHRKHNDTTEIISIEGDIGPGDVERFRQISLRYPKAVVELSSDGGAVMPAIEIGRTLRIAGYGTYVPQGSVCASACALIWLAGTPRLLVGQVGFHAAYRDNDGKPEESGAANALVGNYLTLLGLPAKAILFATTAPPDRVLWLTNANREQTGIDFISPQTMPTKRPAQAIEPPPILIAPTQWPLQTTPSPVITAPPSSAANIQLNWNWPAYSDAVIYELEDEETNEIYEITVSKEVSIDSVI